MNNGIKIKDIKRIMKICEINTVQNYIKKVHYDI